ncbi:unnamed protein product [Cylindrotheca closterium]|uniref:Glutathione transferase n=1 Tax=Cylindrotheca closterium TaxID=2856 RepID=A0AAD2FJ42_9STRA|nr:unnamed protein product [Cylindrotheca closterium]
MDPAPKLKLYYFNMKGKGEPIRLLCAYTGLELEDYRFASSQEFVDLKENGKLAFGQVPMLEVDGKHQLIQSGAIMRYLAKLTKLCPEDPLEAAKVDAIFDQENDAFMGATVASYTTRFGIEMDDATKQKAFDTISKEILPRHLGNLERLLKASSTGWVAGTETPTIADFVWFARFDDYIPNRKQLSENLRSLDDYPECKAFVERFKSLAPIKEYYANQK